MEKNVKIYYDRNTRWFLKLGKLAGTGNIHQALWPAGITTHHQAINYSNHLILQRLPSNEVAPIRALDLGCGVGGGVTYLAENASFDINVTGITISSRQRALATERLQKAGLQDKCKVLEASFQDLPAHLKNFHLAYAIEAFVHSTDARIFFQQAGNALLPGGQLILIDDFMSPESTNLERAKQELATFREGWMLNSLHTVEVITEMASMENMKLAENINLTGWLELDRPRDRFISIITSLLGSSMKRSIYLNSLRGGDARRRCLKNGWVEYRLLRFKMDKVRRAAG